MANTELVISWGSGLARKFRFREVILLFFNFENSYDRTLTYNHFECSDHGITLLLFVLRLG